MKKKETNTLLLAAAVFLTLILFAMQKPVAQTMQKPSATKMLLTGEIAKSQNGYIIRSQKSGAPGEIYSILNPDPDELDPLVNSEKTVSLEVRVVSGDNVEIEKIDGKKYGQKTP